VLRLLERLKLDGIDHDEAIQSCNVVISKRSGTAIAAPRRRT
jgi:hypothetical protein